MRIHPVILAGGRGERFWPLSRRSRPKQLLPLLSDRPMIADSIARLDGVALTQDIWVITARDLLDPVRAAVPSVPREHVVGEPMGKNTAPAVALAAWWLRKAGPDSVVAILPSDHRIEPAARFREELSAAARAALERKAIVTLGIPPTRPDTGYGYIEVGKPVAPGSPLHEVSAFREKPDAATAAKYVADKKHLWNAGMFLFRPDVMLEEIRAYSADLADLVAAVPDPSDRGVDAALDRFYAAATSISIDYAVMERTRRALVARASFEWDDLGELGHPRPARVGGCARKRRPRGRPAPRLERGHRVLGQRARRGRGPSRLDHRADGRRDAGLSARPGPGRAGAGGAAQEGVRWQGAALAFERASASSR